MPDNTGQDRTGLWGLMALQALCVVLLVIEVGWEFYQESLTPQAAQDGKRQQNSHTHAFEFIVIVLLSFSFVSTGYIIHRLMHRHKRTDELLRAATGAFFDLVQQHFDEWELTPSERDVALLAIKGLMISDIAQLRNTKLGTIKAQCASIYRKAGVTGRPQLLSLFIDELIAKGVPECGERCPKSGEKEPRTF
ncbi:LuxR C-terminal-related transcriptional regulator [Nitratireductor sp. XY-223]|uniref:helix-turn-helix transcriptional regulator n=1 Tax=Nitratireductor sp. XY-223 TaxID=2561926 RepID=UPI0019818DD5|nr:LuxR C-terminal-related transcriptional regulator [Nitratireductor sp. XY-223]